MSKAQITSHLRLSTFDLRLPLLPRHIALDLLRDFAPSHVAALSAASGPLAPGADGSGKCSNSDSRKRAEAAVNRDAAAGGEAGRGEQR